MNDSVLVSNYAARGDMEAFARIVEQYRQLVFATCRRKLRNRADVEDAVQETFLYLAQRAAELNTNLGCWLHACAVNVSIDINRRCDARQRGEALTAAQPAPADDSRRTLAELREHLDAALQKLEAGARELLIQRFFVGRSQVDLAAAAGVSPSTLSDRLELANDALREHLKAMGCRALTAGGS